MTGRWSEVYLRTVGAPTVAVPTMGECQRCRSSQPTAQLVDHDFWGTCCSNCLLVLGD